MASPDSDLQNDLRRRARRRLLGAIALALTAAIVLPVVMDHEPRPPAQDIAVRIPTRDSAPPLASPARNDADPFIPPAPPDSEPATPGAARSESSPAAMPPSAPRAEVPRVDTPKAAPQKPDVDKPTPPGPEAPRTGTRPVPVAKPQPEPGEAARAAALLEGKSEAVALQLGVFGDAANVAKLRARAKELGYASFTEEVKLADGQTRTRVKVGPFANRSAAEAAQRKLEAAGMRSMVAPRS